MPDNEFIFTTTKTTTAIATTTLPPTFDSITASLGVSFVHYLNYLSKLPGGDLLLRYIKASYKNDPIRSLFELALFVFAIHYFLRSKRKENKSELVRLSKREVDELIEEWKPVDLAEEVSPIELWQMKSVPVIKGKNAAYVTLGNLTKTDHVANFTTNNFLNLNDDVEVAEASKSVIRNSGVGACSPPNFYGTQDSHVRLEEDLTEYLDTEQSLLYGQDFVTASSVLPAFVKRGDLCVVDTGVNISLQKSLIVSRCDIEWYHHNDMDHLGRILEEIKPTLDKQKPIRRRFIVTEGLFSRDGTIANLPKIVELKNKYKYRLFLDETNTVGILGKTGRGLCEHFNVPRSEVSITIGTLASSLASSGGFCAGVTPMIHHQKLSSWAYCFSAALPPYSAKAASASIQEIKKLNSEGESILMAKLHNYTSYLFAELSKSFESSKFIEFNSDPDSPIIHLSLKESYRRLLNLPEYYGSRAFITTGKHAKYNNPFDAKFNLENFLLQKIIDHLLVNANILITRSKNLLDHENLPILKPHLLIHVNAGVEKSDLEVLINTLADSVNGICDKISSELDLDQLEHQMISY